MKSYNSLLIDKKANYFCELKSIDDCKDAIKFSISKNLDILVVGDSEPTKKKVNKAKELKIKIINESDWYKILNI